MKNGNSKMNAEKHLDNLCHLMESLDIDESDIIAAMIYVAAKRYNVELRKPDNTSSQVTSIKAKR